MSPILQFRELRRSSGLSTGSNSKHDEQTCLIVGLGQRTKKKAIPSLLKLVKDGWVQIAGAVDPFVQTAPIDKLSLYPTVNDFLKANERPTVAYVAVPHHEYKNVLPGLFQAGTNVLKEKPVACNSSEAVELKRQADAHGVRVGVLCQRRFSRRYNALEGWIPLLGKISSVQVVETIDVAELAEGWRARKGLAGGGVVIDMGYHMLDQLVGLFGEQFTVRHAALMKTRQGDYDVDDTAHVSVEFAQGVNATVVLSRSGAKNEERISIIGEGGILSLDGDLVRLSLRDDTGSLTPTEEYTVQEPSSVLLERGLVSFMDGVDAQKWDLSRDIAVMKLIDEIYRLGNESLDTKVAQDPLTKAWSWPKVTLDVERAVDKQLHTTLSIYNNSGIFGQFEKAFSSFHNTPNHHALLHNSGTIALYALYYASGLGSGDEVIVPVYTFHATVSPLMHLGVKPVFVDAHPETGNIDPRKIARAITPKTKAVIVTHMWGVPCAMEEIVTICRKNDILLLEDCSHAHGASVNGQKTGTFGDGAAWSIQGDKVLSGGEGGVSLTPHSEVYYRQLIHGHYNKRCKSEIPKNHPLQDFAVTGAGLKNRAHPLAISIANNQLEKLPAILYCKSRCVAHFIQTLAPVPFLRAPAVDVGCQPAWYALIFRFDETQAPPGLTRERYVQEVMARGMKHIDIPNSTRPLYDEALYKRPWDVLGHVYKPNTYTVDWEAADFPGAVTFHSSVIKLPVWAYEDDWDTVEACAQVMLNVAIDFMKTTLN
ncbi:DegT/DnrJ/EryC1/StrS aminotransferase family-domain-containing protein [Aspergillus pseudotamarii]|uniref:DegT/DnrJ/EryC1/StrS aminotransferase family-domain-containing protein n=1 Tax=Aspergillus pseudotamarii TaxID=132259 RepID=A0A5N6T7Z0_ASPPS|nr:DegT/DnrJ/EryC1/StrS aminotransferase family-domain-containing protein [Aspergillus pseudotamarii]KAE8142319.1 DegT/DnrJ/EryC1/StrS aminotransferase family-domain-containing protein [Aspergillus pseudotamarii]